MDDEVDTVLMKKQNMPDRKVIVFLTMYTLQILEMCLIFKLFIFADTE